MATLYEEIVEAMGELSGVHSGHRAAHAKGSFCRGTFTAAPEARELTRAAHMQGEPVDVTARFSNGSGNPDDRDASRREGRGMATQFGIGDGESTDIVAITLPVFFVRTAEDFLEFVRARKPDPATGEMDMEKIGAFVGAHPETQAALELILPTFVPPVSYATCEYNSLHAFGFENEAGERRFGRYRWEPAAGLHTLADEAVDGASPDYLQDEIAERLADGPVVFTLQVKLAAEDDPLDDSTVPWPDDREVMTLGRMELTKTYPDAEDEEIVVFDPTRITDGIETSDDEILAARPHAYSISAERRAAARNP
ncbi:MAG: catalase family peroxidase [Solirubrobacterales bacterium]